MDDGNSVWIDFSEHNRNTGENVKAELLLTDDGPFIRLSGVVENNVFQHALLKNIGFEKQAGAHIRPLRGLTPESLKLAYPGSSHTRQSKADFVHDMRSPAQQSTSQPAAIVEDQLPSFIRSAINWLEKRTESVEYASGINCQRYEAPLPPAYSALVSHCQKYGQQLDGQNSFTLETGDDQALTLTVPQQTNEPVRIDFHTIDFFKRIDELFSSEAAQHIAHPDNTPFTYEGIAFVRLETGMFSALEAVHGTEFRIALNATGPSPQQILKHLSNGAREKLVTAADVVALNQTKPITTSLTEAQPSEEVPGALEAEKEPQTEDQHTQQGAEIAQQSEPATATAGTSKLDSIEVDSNADAIDMPRPLSTEGANTTEVNEVTEFPVSKASNAKILPPENDESPESSAAASTPIVSLAERKLVQENALVEQGQEALADLRAKLNEAGIDLDAFSSTVEKFVSVHMLDQQAGSADSLSARRLSVEAQSEVSDYKQKMLNVGYELDESLLLKWAEEMFRSKLSIRERVEKHVNDGKPWEIDREAARQTTAAIICPLILNYQSGKPNKIAGIEGASTLIIKRYGSTEHNDRLATLLVEKTDIAELQHLADEVILWAGSKYHLEMIPHAISRLEREIEADQGSSPIPNDHRRSKIDSLREQEAELRFGIAERPLKEEDLQLVREAGSYTEAVEVLAERHGISVTAGGLLFERLREESHRRFEMARMEEPDYKRLTALAEALREHGYVFNKEQMEISKSVGHGNIVVGKPVAEGDHWEFFVDYDSSLRWIDTERLPEISVSGDDWVRTVFDTLQRYEQDHSTVVRCDNLPRYGSAFESAREESGTGVYGIPEINKHLRSAVKEAKKAGSLPKDIQLTISGSNGYRTITFNVKSVPAGFRVLTPEYVRWHYQNAPDFKDPGDRPQKFDIDYLALLRFLTAQANAWNYDNSDSQADYHNKNFNVEVKLASAHEEQLLKQIATEIGLLDSDSEESSAVDADTHSDPGFHNEGSTAAFASDDTVDVTPGLPVVDHENVATGWLISDAPIGGWVLHNPDTGEMKDYASAKAGPVLHQKAIDFAIENRTQSVNKRVVASVDSDEDKAQDTSVHSSLEQQEDSGQNSGDIAPKSPVNLARSLGDQFNSARVSSTSHNHPSEGVLSSLQVMDRELSAVFWYEDNSPRIGFLLEPNSEELESAQRVLSVLSLATEQEGHFTEVNRLQHSLVDIDTGAGAGKYADVIRRLKTVTSPEESDPDIDSAVSFDFDRYYTEKVEPFVSRYTEFDVENHIETVDPQYQHGLARRLFNSRPDLRNPIDTILAREHGLSSEQIIAVAHASSHQSDIYTRLNMVVPEPIMLSVSVEDANTLNLMLQELARELNALGVNIPTAEQADIAGLLNSINSASQEFLNTLSSPPAPAPNHLEAQNPKKAESLSFSESSHDHGGPLPSPVAGWTGQQGRVAKNLGKLINDLGIADQLHGEYYAVLKNSPYLDLVIESHLDSERDDSRILYFTHYLDRGTSNVTMDSELVVRLDRDGTLTFIESATIHPIHGEARAPDYSFGSLLASNFVAQGFNNATIEIGDDPEPDPGSDDVPHKQENNSNGPEQTRHDRTPDTGSHERADSGDSPTVAGYSHADTAGAGDGATDRGQSRRTPVQTGAGDPVARDDRLSAAGQLPDKAETSAGRISQSTDPERPLEASDSFELTNTSDEVELFSPREQLQRIQGNHNRSGAVEQISAAINIYVDLITKERSSSTAEREILAQFIGMGSAHIRPYFDRPWDGNYHSLRQAMKKLEDVDPDAHEALKQSVLTSFYTPVPVVDFMWSATQKMGLAKTNRQLTVTDPGCGVGNFIGLSPKSMHDRLRFTAVDADPVAARITQELYPSIKVLNAELQKTQIPNDSQDLVIGNPPYGEFSVYDTRYKSKHLIHDYFLKRAVDMAKPGGLVPFVTSAGTLDKKNPAIRREIARNADLVHAIRLPDSAFDSAGTSVTTDILFFRKRHPHEEPGNSNWVESIKAPSSLQLENADQDTYLNRYFLDNPDHVHGQMFAKIGQFGPELTVHNDDPNALQDLMRHLDHIPADIFDAKATASVKRARKRFSDDTLVASKIGSFVQTDSGLALYRGNDEFEHYTPRQKKHTAALIDFIALRNATLALLDAERNGSTDEVTQPLREHLNEQYDTFTGNHGWLNDRKTRKIFDRDPDAFLVLALEHYDHNVEVAEKASIFAERVIKQEAETSALNINDAIALSLNEYGYIDAEFAANKLNQPLDHVVEALQKHAFRDPEQPDVWVAKALYLAGNIRVKLETAASAAKLDPVFEHNVEGLKSVLPADVPIDDITVRLGVHWLGDEIMQEFVADTLELDYKRERVRVSYNDTLAEWKVDITQSALSDSVSANTRKYGTKDASFVEILKETLKLKQPTIWDKDPDGRRYIDFTKTAAARAKQVEIQDHFNDWLKSDSKRAEIVCKRYNALFNSLVEPKFDGSYLTFPGMAKSLKGKPLKLHQHQYEAVERVITSKTGVLLAHEAGAGKTIEQITAAMELKRLGVAQKPLIVVPNHMLEQFTNEAFELYPGAKVLTASRDDFSTPESRALFAAKSRTSDWDLVICTHSMWERMALPDEFVEAQMNSELAQYEAQLREAKSKGDRWTERKMAAATLKLKAKLEEFHDKASARKDQIQFDECGFDYTFYDEGHYLKNIAFPSKAGQISGINNMTSQRGRDAMMKFDFIREKRGDDRGITLATATPLTNSISELYVMLRLTAPDLLRQIGLEHFDHFLANFGQIQEHVEIKPEGGGYQIKQRLSKFHNVPEMVMAFRQIADIKTAEDLNLPTPRCTDHMHVAPAGELLKLFMDYLAKRATRVRSGSVDPCSDNLLKISSEGRLASLDPRLLHPALPDNPESKVNLCIKNVFTAWQAGMEDKRTQLIFCDRGTPGKKDFSIYEDIKQKLITKGIPAEQIAFIHDAKNDQQKEAIFARVRAGDIRVLLGSSDKMGVGTNVQTRGSDLHMLDIPWRPIDVQQRRKRLERQGCIFDEVNIHFYSTEDSFDLFMLETVNRKLKFITQGMASPEKCARSMEEDIDPTYAEIMAITTGNSLIKDKVEVDNEVEQLAMLRRAHKSACRESSWTHENITDNKIPEMQKTLKTLAESWKRVKLPADENFRITVDGQNYNKHGIAGEAIHKAITRRGAYDSGFHCGEYAGIPFRVVEDDRHFFMVTNTPIPIRVQITKNPAQFVSQFEQKVKGLKNSIAKTEEKIAQLQAFATEELERSEAPWAKEEEYVALRIRQQELDQLVREQAGKKEEQEENGSIHPFLELIESLKMGTETLSQEDALQVSDILAVQAEIKPTMGM